MMERRKEGRRRCFLIGEITLAKGCPPVDCLLCNVSESGALLMIDETIELPAEFELYVHGRRRRFRGTPVWSDQTFHGVTVKALAAEIIPFGTTAPTTTQTS